MGAIIRQMSVHTQIATPEGKREYVRTLFATIADRYDLITVVLSYGQDRRWKRRVVEQCSPVEGTRALDLATGTGDLAHALARRGALVVGLDLTPRMIELARARAAAGTEPAFVVGDMLALPFPPASFDLVTVGYGLRNVADLDAAIDEMLRVLRPGGQVVSLDFDRPPNPVVRSLYLAYLSIVGGALGWVLHRDPDTYRYIPASIRLWPGAAGVAARLQARGFSRVRRYPLLGGLMALHQAFK
jgi:demethylmenaquinone methyltransferase/2-methoxy-6-polyprenyl-1,4-benzoquinol methylase